MAGMIEEWAQRVPEMEIVSIVEAGVKVQGPLAERLHYAIERLHEEHLLVKKYDYAWLKVAMDTLDL